MKRKTPLIDKTYLLEKFSGKGGWTYAAIPEIAQNKNTPFGWVKVKGNIDSYVFELVKLMPMGNGQLFFPVKNEIRKQLKKEAGDSVHIVLFLDESKFEIPDEILACFENEPKNIYTRFKNFTEGEQKAYIDWIYLAKKDETKADRIIKMMNRLQQGIKLHDKQ